MKKEYIEVATPGGTACIRVDTISLVLDTIGPFDSFPSRLSNIYMLGGHKVICSTETASQIYEKIDDSYGENYMDEELRNCFVFTVPNEKEVRSYCSVWGNTVDEAVSNAMETMYVGARWALFQKLRGKAKAKQHNSRFKKSEKYPLRWTDCEEGYPNFIEPVIGKDEINPDWEKAKTEVYFNVRSPISAKIGIMTIWPPNENGGFAKVVIGQAENPVDFKPNTVEMGYMLRN